MADAGEWQQLKPNATWWREVAFDERVHCFTHVSEARQALCSARACGTWLVARFPLHRDAMLRAELQLRSGRAPRNWDHGAPGVAGHAEKAGDCTTPVG